MKHKSGPRTLTHALLVAVIACSPGCKKKPVPSDQREETRDRGGKRRKKPAAKSPEERGVEFVGLLARDEFEHAFYRFTPQMKQALPQSKLERVWQGVKANVGPFQAVEKTGVERRDKLTAVNVTGRFANGRVVIRVVLTEKGKVAGLFFRPAKPKHPYSAPQYAKPDRFTEQDVKVGAGEWMLPGTLTLPKSPPGKKVPAVVLVHGSGPHDRDETIGPNRPFKDLAWGLASRGIAVLRYDKRTKTHGSKLRKVQKTFTVWQETIDDALEAVTMLRKHHRIDRERVFVLGHSLGGYVIPRIGMKNPPVAGYLILAGSTRPLHALIIEQLTYIQSLGGARAERINRQLPEIKKAVARITDPKLRQDADPKLLNDVPASYWLDLRGYRPTRAAQLLTQPVLVLQGDRDYQVTLKDFEGWRKAFKGRKNVTFKRYADLNHLFMPGRGRPGPQDYDTPGHVAAAVIDDIARFVERAKAPAPR